MLKKLMPIATVIIMLTLAGCGESPEQLFQVAELEEVQNNHSHAIELYEEIIEQHPKSEYAAKSEERLKILRARLKEEQR